MRYLNDLTIYLTEKCNFNCSYCYYNKNFTTTLDLGKLEKCLNLLFSQVDKEKKVNVTILGGEPFLEKTILFQTVDKINKIANKKSISIGILLFTNGSILLKEDLKQLFKKNVRIYLSLDGSKKSNDSYRKFRYNQSISTFDLIMNNLNSLPKEYLKNMHINMVIGPKNCKHLMENVRFLSKFGFSSIDLSLLSYSHWPKKSLKELIEQLNIFYKYYTSMFIENKGVPFKIHQLGELFSGGWDKMDRCNRLKLAPDGNLYFCDAFFSIPCKKRSKYKVGNVKNGFSIEKIENLREEAKIGIKDIFPKTFLLHEQDKQIYCPYGVYFYSKLHRKNLKKSLKNFYLFSRIHSSLLMYLFNKLKDNKKFINFYKKDFNINQKNSLELGYKY